MDSEVLLARTCVVLCFAHGKQVSTRIVDGDDSSMGSQICLVLGTGSLAVPVEVVGSPPVWDEFLIICLQALC